MKKTLILILALATGLGVAGAVSVAGGSTGTVRAVSCPPGHANDPAYCTTTPDPPPPTTTTTPPTTTTTTPPPAPKPPSGTATADANGKSVSIDFTCPAGAPTNCVGTIVLTADDQTGSTRAHAAKVVEIGRTSYNIAPGQTATIKVPLNSQGQQILDSQGKVTVKAVAMPQGGGQVYIGNVSIQGAYTASPKGKSPKALTAKVSPKRDKSKPFQLTASGKLTLPKGVKKSAGCKGRVNVTFRQGTTVVGTKSSTLKSNCSYSVAVKLLANAKKGKVKAAAKFLGNPSLKPKAAKSVTVTIG